ncbi:ribbon-helix-helix domain-containing protein [Tardiphaga sp. vice154]|uniref:ribbon-helix-helix domain-containing protein n=1 Tax=Tardiphaga sp. vice154 TaxID=2592814 RepID=UPI00116495DB|nr:ribbon-helix-helix domain-containing protein [Tardiphaga sp. vice154]QDM24163.1 ribbon-helix-helix domain-containing protein [Tardiphaga sp. vice154]
MKAPITKRSVLIGKKKTSVSLEHEFWDALKEIAKADGLTANELVCKIHGALDRGNLSSAIRVFVLYYYKLSEPVLLQVFK